MKLAARTAIPPYYREEVDRERLIEHITRELHSELTAGFMNKMRDTSSKKFIVQLSDVSHYRDTFGTDLY